MAWVALWCLLALCACAPTPVAGPDSGIARIVPRDAAAASARVADAAGDAPVRMLRGAGGRGTWDIVPVPGSGERLLLVFHPYGARVTVWAPGAAPRTQTVFDRDLDPRFSRRALAFPFQGDGPLRVRMDGARYPLQVRVAGAAQYSAIDLMHVRIISSTVGVLIGIVLVVLIFWLLLRERVYLLYAATMGLQLLYLLCAYGEAYATPGLRLLAGSGVRGIWTIATLSTAAAALFLVALADLDQHAPRASRWLRWIAAWLPLGLLLPLWLPWPADKDWFPPLGNGLLLVANALALAALGLAWRRGNRRAAYTLIAWVPLVSLSTLRALQLSAGAPLGPLVEYGLPAVLALASVLLVLVLADRMLAVRRERDSAQARSERDPLTGMLNRSGIGRSYAQAYDAAVATGEPLALLFLDLDRFKQVNDTHGHAIGDACLQAMVRAAVGELGHRDAIGRYGGEEFLVVSPGSGRRQARDLGERIRAAVQARCASVAGAPVALTVSIGAAERLPGDTPEALLQRADQAQYAAKHGGRNRVVLAPAAGA